MFQLGSVWPWDPSTSFHHHDTTICHRNRCLKPEHLASSRTSHLAPPQLDQQFVGPLGRMHPCLSSRNDSLHRRPQETTGDQRDLGSPRRVIGGTAQHLHDLNAPVVYFVLLSPEAFQFIPENVKVLRAAKAYSRLTWTQCKARSCNLLQGFDVFFLARLVTGRHYDCSIEPPRPTLWRAMLWIEPAQLHAPAFMWSIDIIL